MKPKDNDEEFSDEELTERVCEEGDWVLSLHWDSGGPGAGAGVESIYKFKNQYWYYSIDNGLSGPFDSLTEALDGFGVTDATERIDCAELTAAELADRLDLDHAEPGHRLQINDEEWEVSSDGKLERV
jgi:hypothetical protein